MTFDVKNEHEIFQYVSVGNLNLVKGLLEKDPHLISLRESNYQATPLIVAASYGQLETIQWLLQAGGAKIDEIDKREGDAFLHAAGSGHLKVVQWLLRSGANISKQDKYKETALLWSAYDGQLEVVQWYPLHITG